MVGEPSWLNHKNEKKKKVGDDSLAYNLSNGVVVQDEVLDVPSGYWDDTTATSQSIHHSYNIDTTAMLCMSPSNVKASDTIHIIDIVGCSDLPNASNMKSCYTQSQRIVSIELPLYSKPSYLEGIANVRMGNAFVNFGILFIPFFLL